MSNTTNQAPLEILEYWKRVLRLQDWEIVLKVKPFRDMDDCRGETNYHLQKKCAIISLLDPDDSDRNEDFPYDLEQTMVHELLHLHFVDDGHTPEECPLVFEQGINAVGAALVTLNRK